MAGDNTMTYHVRGGLHVYEGERPVATFLQADEAAAFVTAVNLVTKAEET